MTIKANNFIIKGVDNNPEKVERPKDWPQPPVKVDTPIVINNITIDKNKTYLVVNGKLKEISPKSKYLLDMLIIN